MLDLVRDILSWILIVGGGVFLVIGAIGLIRMPDFFSRMHAASVLDTFGAGLILIGLMVQGGLTLVTAKLIFLLLFLLVTGPTATHAMARAAVYAGVKPLLDPDAPQAEPLIDVDGVAAPDAPDGGTQPSNP